MSPVPPSTRLELHSAARTRRGWHTMKPKTLKRTPLGGGGKEVEVGSFVAGVPSFHAGFRLSPCPRAPARDPRGRSTATRTAWTHRSSSTRRLWDRRGRRFRSRDSHGADRFRQQRLAQGLRGTLGVANSRSSRPRRCPGCLSHRTTRRTRYGIHANHAPVHPGRASSRRP